MNVTKRKVCIYIMVFLAIVVNLQAQDNHALLQKQVRTNATSLSIDSLSRLITVQTGVYLSFNANKVIAGSKISLRKRIFTVNEVLDLIKINTGSGYKVYHEHVIFHGGDKIKMKPGDLHAIDRTNFKKGRLPDNDNIEGTIQHKNKFGKNTPGKSNALDARIAKNGGESPNGNELTKTANKPNSTELTNSAKKPAGKENKAAPLISGEKPLTATPAFGEKIQAAPPITGEKNPTPFVKQDLSNNQLAPQFQIERLNVSQLLNTPIRPALSHKPEPAAPRFRQNKSFNKNFGLYAETGLAVDEAIYLQPNITAGIPVIHAIFSWGTNFKVSGFRYGLGSSIPLKDDWRIGIQVTTGKLKKAADFGVMINTDTLKGFSVKSDLHRISLQVEKQIGSRLILKAGPVFNLLKSTYLKNGKPIALNTVGFVTDESAFYTVRPPYTLSNNFKLSESSSTKTWIGFQVSLFYRINFRI